MKQNYITIKTYIQKLLARGSHKTMVIYENFLNKFGYLYQEKIQKTQFIAGCVTRTISFIKLIAIENYGISEIVILMAYIVSILMKIIDLMITRFKNH